MVVYIKKSIQLNSYVNCDYNNDMCAYTYYIYISYKIIYEKKDNFREDFPTWRKRALLYYAIFRTDFWFSVLIQVLRFITYIYVNRKTQRLERFG